MRKDYAIVLCLAVAAAVILLGIFISSLHDLALPAIYIIYDYEKGDPSYTDSAYRGLVAAREKMDFTREEFTSLDQEKIHALLQDDVWGKSSLVHNGGVPVCRWHTADCR